MIYGNEWIKVDCFQWTNVLSYVSVSPSFLFNHRAYTSKTIPLHFTIIASLTVMSYTINGKLVSNLFFPEKSVHKHLAKQKFHEPITWVLKFEKTFLFVLLRLLVTRQVFLLVMIEQHSRMVKFGRLGMVKRQVISIYIPKAGVRNLDIWTSDSSQNSRINHNKSKSF